MTSIRGELNQINFVSGKFPENPEKTGLFYKHPINIFLASDCKAVVFYEPPTPLAGFNMFLQFNGVPKKCGVFQVANNFLVNIEHFFLIS